MKNLKVTFEYTSDENTKSLKTDFAENYTYEEREELLTYIIDTILPTSMMSVDENKLYDAWQDFKYARENGRHKNDN